MAPATTTALGDASDIEPTAADLATHADAECEDDESDKSDNELLPAAGSNTAHGDVACDGDADTAHSDAACTYNVGTNMHTAANGDGDADPVDADVSHGDSAAGDPQKPFAVHLPQYCCQHMTGNVVEACTKFLGVLSPTFCMASCLSHGDIADQLLADVDDYIEKNLEVDDPAERPLAPNEEKELQFQEDLLEACYVITLAIPLSVMQGLPLPLRGAIA